jgi:hypothetical protein
MRTERHLGALALALMAALPTAAQSIPEAAPAAAVAVAAAPTPRGTGGAERSLEAITIEGVAQGPEVLFINAREPARVELMQGWRLVAAAGLLEPTLPAPRTLRSAAADPHDPKLETDPILNL